MTSPTKKSSNSGTNSRKPPTKTYHRKYPIASVLYSIKRRGPPDVRSTPIPRPGKKHQQIGKCKSHRGGNPTNSHKQSLLRRPPPHPRTPQTILPIRINKRRPEKGKISEHRKVRILLIRRGIHHIADKSQP